MSSTTGPAALPSHPDAHIEGAETPFSRFLRVDVVRFRHRLFSGEWSAERVYDVLRRGDAVALMLYDPDRDSVVLVEQFRLPALYAGLLPWQIEPVAGLVDKDENYEAVARRESREEAGIQPIGELIPVHRYMPSPGDSDEAVMLFCGRADSRAAAGTHGLPEEQEDIRVMVKTIAELEAMVEAGQIQTGHTLIGCYWASAKSGSAVRRRLAFLEMFLVCSYLKTGHGRKKPACDALSRTRRRSGCPTRNPIHLNPTCYFR